MNHVQPGILATPVPAQAIHLFFSITQAEPVQAALDRLLPLVDGEQLVVGLGASLTRQLGLEVPGLRSFPNLQGSSVDIPSTPHALWLWLRGEDRGELLHRKLHLQQLLAPALQLMCSTESFRYRSGHDLSGYEDGTENPQDEDAVAAAVVSGQGNMDGSSFAVVQHWLHDLQYFARLPATEQDHIFGRRQSDNEELEDAPDSAHVKRTAQESFTPQAFILRRSMPWAAGEQAGLVFLAFGHSFAAFEAQMQRMAGLEDGIVDGLFRFSRPISGSYYWCPPLTDGRLCLDIHQSK